MANIYVRKAGDGTKRYYGNITIKGERLRKYLGISRGIAELNLKKLEYQLIFESTPIDEIPKITVVAAVRSFMKSVELSGIGKRQITTISARVNRFKSFSADNRLVNIDEVRPFYARDFVTIRKQSKCPIRKELIKISTLNKEIQILKRFFNYCLMMEWIKNNPFAGIRNFKDSAKRQRFYFTESHLETIMNNAGKFYDFYCLLFETGIRATDAYKLTPENFKNGYLTVDMNKTGDFLHVPVKKPLLNQLKPRMGNGLIFPGIQEYKDKRNCVKVLQAQFSKDFVRSNNINLHTFRHTYAHTMLNKGVPKEVLQTLLGHRSIKTTEIYANWVRKEELEKWV